MREILFRGKRIDNGEWVFGFYSALQDCVGIVHMIETPKANPDETNVTYFVDPSTVGQFTGLLGKNGKRIFEGDVVECREYENFAVVWDDGAFQLMREDTFYDMLDRYTSGISTVVGNRWDNPELLEASENG